MDLVYLYGVSSNKNEITNVSGYRNDNKTMESLYVGHDCQPGFFVFKVQLGQFNLFL